MLRWIICKTIISKPKISIDEHSIIGFNPPREIWQVRIMNRKISGWQRWFFCKRDTLEDCSFEADFLIDGETPKFAVWNNFTLRPNSYRHEIELISKLHGEDGFHIKRPDNDTFISTRQAIVLAKLKSGQDIIKQAKWQITVLGKWSSDLEFKRLD